MNASATSSAVGPLRGIASGHRVVWSMIMRTCLHPSDAGRGPTMSTLAREKLCWGTGNLAQGRVCALVDLVPLALEAPLSPSSHVFGHTLPDLANLSLMSFLVIRTDGWDKPWTMSKAGLRQSAGRIRWLRPRNTLHMTLMPGSNSTHCCLSPVIAIW